MALGGGTFLVQNKKLPGSYINFVSLPTASATLSDRGTVTMPLTLDWGPDDAVFTVENGDFIKNSMKYFGYDYTSDKLKGLRDLFMNAITLHAYRLNSGGAKASNKFCTAKYTGSAGNRLSTVIAVNVDDEALFDVSTYMDRTVVDTQTVAKAEDLVPNEFVVWKTDAALEETAKTPLSAGSNGTANAAAYQAFLDKIESYSFNTLGLSLIHISEPTRL